jgi:predicted metal-binding protein
MKSLYKKPDNIRQIAAEIDLDQLTEDLEQLKNKAINMGADEAAVIHNQDIIFSPELLAHINADNSYASIHWPILYPKDNIEEAIRMYQWGVFFRIIVDTDFPDYGGGPIPDDQHRRTYLKIYEITTAIESAGFYMGYHLSLGLASGNCRAIFCHEEKRCWPMIKGKVCVHPNKGRPSMEAAGIDAAAMAEKLKWEIKEKAKCPVLAGLVLIV